MKITRNIPKPAFIPVVITLETVEELAHVLGSMGETSYEERVTFATSFGLSMPPDSAGAGTSDPGIILYRRLKEIAKEYIHEQANAK